MAEAAAPSAPVPSTGAPSTAQPAPGAPNPGTFVPDSGTHDVAAPDTVQRLSRPIRPIPRLPGVYPDAIDDGPFPPPPSSPDSPSGSAVPPRGPDGRFLATSSATPAPPGEGVHTLEPATPAGPAPQPARFKFAGEEFPSQEAAEQNFKSLRGQYRPLQSLAKSLGGVDKIVPQFQSAAESARGWKAEAERARAELAAIRNGQAPAAAPATPPTAQPAEAAEPADVDWELYAEVKKLATERNEPWKAEQWLISEVRKVERARLDALLAERDAPLKAQQEKQAVVAQTDALFGALADYTHEDGSAAFPELSDPEASYEIGRLWASLGLPRQAALTQAGAIAAISTYRELKRAGSQARAAAQPPPTAQPPPSLAPPTDTRSAAALTDGRPSVASVSANGAPSAEAARIQAALRSTHSPNRAVLGFDA